MNAVFSCLVYLLLFNSVAVLTPGSVEGELCNDNIIIRFIIII